MVVHPSHLDPGWWRGQRFPRTRGGRALNDPPNCSKCCPQTVAGVALMGGVWGSQEETKAEIPSNGKVAKEEQHGGERKSELLRKEGENRDSGTGSLNKFRTRHPHFREEKSIKQRNRSAKRVLDLKQIKNPKIGVESRVWNPRKGDEENWLNNRGAEIQQHGESSTKDKGGAGAAIIDKQ
ncbi:hypothetical protein K438DRAFT_1781522 [Mycena galopus ATCC 62051]|nr:hypothetical protein K438DRAFT_1781522 [Mycena galopus ATCC 62051]